MADETSYSGGEPTRERWLNRRFLSRALVLYAGFFAIYGLVVWFALGTDRAGIFGDMFGALNTFVSGLAMLGVIAAIFLQLDQIQMQAHELSLQRRELTLQREEMKLNREELRLQREEIALNRAELARAAEAQDKSQKALTNAAYAQVYRTVVDILQDEDVRRARRTVLEQLASRPFSAWGAPDIKAAERVCNTYDSVGIMIRHGMLPVEYVADSWGDSLRRTWAILRPLVYTYRSERNAPEYWNDYEYLAGEAAELAKRRGADSNLQRPAERGEKPEGAGGFGTGT